MFPGKHTLAVAILLLLISCGHAMAWNSVGHMTVAYSAYQQLTSVEKARAAALLQLNPYYSKWLTYIPAGTSDADRDMYVFMMAATWPDEIKAMGSGYTGNDNPPRGELATLNGGYGDKQAHKYWHFINTPFSQDGTALPPVGGPTLPQKIGVFRQALATGEPDLLKSYDLVWLLHLVGDVHQPLHCATRVTKANPHGDLGGNSVVVNGPAKELHAFWDDAVGLGDTKNFMAAVKVGQTLPKADANLAADANQDDWAAESFALAKSAVYLSPVGPGLGPYTLDATYTAETQQIAKQRIALAGARLATLLKTALNCGNQTCAN
ncbi:MAG: S1/P1 nuclease [Terriglobia bacterium]|nr:S1/P1 nuclease [Terriglobia bacterium]